MRGAPRREHRSRAMTLRALVAFVFALAQSRAHALDDEIDAMDERSDNYRTLVHGIRCGACKAVTSELGAVFASTAAKHRADAGTTNAFGGRYVSQFRTKFAREADGVCASEGVIEREWGYSKQGAENIINTTRVFDRLGSNITKEEASLIQLTVFGLGLFTKDANERFHYRGPPGSEEQGSNTYSMISNTFARNTLREACRAVSESLEFEDAVDDAISKAADEGFDFGVQHKLCLQLEYCKLKNRNGKSRPIERVKQKDGTVSYELDSELKTEASADSRSEL